MTNHKPQPKQRGKTGLGCGLGIVLWSFASYLGGSGPSPGSDGTTIGHGVGSGEKDAKKVFGSAKIADRAQEGDLGTERDIEGIVSTMSKYVASSQRANMIPAPHAAALELALYESAESGDVKTLKTLVKKGANINFQHKAFGGRTALHAACDSGESSAAVALVELKCDLELKDRNGNLPIECAGECTPPYTLQFPSTNPLMCARDNIDFLFLMSA